MALLGLVSIMDIVKVEKHLVALCLFWDMGKNIGLISYTHWQMELRMFNQRSQAHVIYSLWSFLKAHDLFLWLFIWVWNSSPVITVLLSPVTHRPFRICFCLLHKSTTEHFLDHMPYAKAFLIIVFPTSEREVSRTVTCYFRSRVVFAGSCCTCTLITGQPWHMTPHCVVCGSALRSGSHRRWSKRRGTPAQPFYSPGSLPLKTSGLHWQ